MMVRKLERQLRHLRLDILNRSAPRLRRTKSWSKPPQPLCTQVSAVVDHSYMQTSLTCYRGMAAGADTVRLCLETHEARILTQYRPQAPSSLIAFVLAMTLDPTIQCRAQAELDAVLGPPAQCTRLPTFGDRAALPYVNAIVLEALRWQPSVPLGLAHQVSEDDVYRGWMIPKGTVVWANIWCVDCHRGCARIDGLRLCAGPYCKIRMFSQSRRSLNLRGS